MKVNSGIARNAFTQKVALSGEPWDLSCGLSDCDPVTWTRLLVVNDVLVSPSSAVAGMCEGVSSDSEGEFVEKRSFSFSKKRSENQEEMSYEGSPVKSPPTSRRRMMPPTPQQSSHSSTDDSHWQEELGARRGVWCAPGWLRRWRITWTIATI